MAISNAAWDGSPSNWPDSASYCAACLIDENPAGKDKVQALCHLPVKTPEGDVSRNAVHAAASALAGGRGGVKTSSANKAAAARKLVRLYGELKEPVPDSIKSLAR